MKLGITGGIGCGKSTVARSLEQRGFRRLDSDQIVREQVLADPAVIAALVARYGDGVVERAGADGRLVVRRPVLAERVFADDAERIWLEELTHPGVFAVWRASFAAEPLARWAVEVPLLFEKGLEKWFDFTICVACAPAQQLARLEQRGLPRALAGQRISKQLPLARKIELSDFVLWNEGTPSFLEAQVDCLINDLPAA
ncbi:MAG: dephospho-CoA kinase [Opitutaceae bacterium]|nr:dephospho-CoA kinase [Opitutaceae bacterium]